jgi:outer membrane protein assembly factor BamB
MIALIVALYAGCASTQRPARHRAPSVAIDASAPSGLSLIWRNTDLRPVGQPIAIGDVVVGIVAEDHKAFVVGIDPASGRMLWHDAITHSTIARGEPISVLKVGDNKIAYLRMTHEDSRLGNLVVADVRTGKELASAPVARFPSAPIVCANGKDVCAISTQDYVPKRQYRLDLSSGQYIAENTLLLPGTRFIDTTGLLDLGDRPGNTLGLLRNGAVRWLTKISAAFPSESSTDDGWDWTLYPDLQVFVGTVGNNSHSVNGKYSVFDYTTVAMAGLSERTGEVLWRNTGSHLGCNLRIHNYPIRCRTRGKAWFHTDRLTFHLADLDVTVEGFDPATGKTTWSLQMGAAEQLEDLVRYPAIAGPGQVLVNGRNGPVVLDYAEGTLQAPEEGARFWCMERATYEMAPPYQRATANWSYERRGGTLASICDAAGRLSTQLPSIAATMAAGARVGNLAVIATHDGYLGFKAP